MPPRYPTRCNDECQAPVYVMTVRFGTLGDARARTGSARRFEYTGDVNRA